MSENQEDKSNDSDISEDEDESDDLQTYLREMKALESDFSDLDDLDMEELQEIQDAISKVKENENLITEELIEENILPTEIYVELKEEQELKNAMISDFSDMDEIDLDELREMQDAIETVKQENLSSLEGGEEGEIHSSQGISKELEDRIKEELLKRKETVEEDVVTPEKFLNYVSNKRDKIWYHALHYLVFEVEDNNASKSLLFDVLKEVTSKSPIDPIPEHQFYFGLGYILRLSLNNKQVVRFMKGGKLKININVENLKEILEESGSPISKRPVFKEEEKKKMYDDFLKDDFLDI